MTVVLAPWQISSSAVCMLRKLLETTAGWREVKAFADIYTGSGGRDGEFIRYAWRAFQLEDTKDFREVPNTMVVSLDR